MKIDFRVRKKHDFSEPEREPIDIDTINDSDPEVFSELVNKNLSLRRQNLMVESKQVEWTKKDDEKLMALHSTFHGNWERISAEFGGKKCK